MLDTGIRELLRREEVETRLGVSRSWIYAEMRAGRFPEPVKIGKRAVRWRVADLNQLAVAQARWLRGNSGHADDAGGSPARSGLKRSRPAPPNRSAVTATGVRSGVNEEVSEVLT